jgi:hypothetical protein
VRRTLAQRRYCHLQFIRSAVFAGKRRIELDELRQVLGAVFPVFNLAVDFQALFALMAGDQLIAAVGKNPVGLCVPLLG